MGILIAYDDYLQNITPTSTASLQSGVPLTNIKTAPLAQVARFTSTTVNIRGDLGSALPIQFMAMLGYNAVSAGGVSLKLSNVAAGDDDVFSDSFDYLIPSNSAWQRQAFWDLGVGMAARYFEMSTTFTGVTFAEVGRFWLGPRIAIPLTGATDPGDMNRFWTMRFEDSGEVVRSRTSQAFPRHGRKTRVLAFSIEQFGSTVALGGFQGASVLALNQVAGVSGQVIAVPQFNFLSNADSRMHALGVYGTLVQDPSLTLVNLGGASGGNFPLWAGNSYRVRETH
jgi:hypothetical protein